MPRIKCFLLEPTIWVRDTLRRYSTTKLPDGKPNEQRMCPLLPGRYAYHNAETELEDRIEADDLCYAPWDRTDARWPFCCSCGYHFEDFDEWSYTAHRLYRRIGTDERMPLRSAPVGAMWYADWITNNRSGSAGDLWFGPDGRCLMIRTPGGDWAVDGPSPQRPADHGWTRIGRPPVVSVIPSIQIGTYHGWLTEGYLVDL